MGITMLLTTHYLEEASQLCDRLIILHKGEILEEGAPLELIERHVGGQALELGVKPEEHSLLLERAGELLKAHHVLGDILILFTNSGSELEERIASGAQSLGVSLSSRRLRSTNLEDVYLKLTGETFKDNPGEYGDGEHE